MRKNLLRTIAGAALLPLALAACGGGGASGGGGGGGQATGELSYWLWDANQKPAYQACADAFAQKNPGSTVKITQLGWDDYWNRITTGLVSGTAPDVFTNHLAKYPDFASKKQILAINDFVEKDKVDVNAYQEGLADLWVDPEGNRFGLPKDWDTIAIFYNKKLVQQAGVTEEQLKTLTWNPQDGGTYEKVIAKLTVDKNGKRGDEPGFDKKKVAVYGLGLENAGAGVGQTQWSMYAGSTGWRATDKETWGTEYNYDDPRFQDTIKWWRGLIDKGYMPPLEVATSGVSMNDAFGAGKAALNTSGSWMIGSYYGYKGVDVGVAPTPVGPEGKRASMFNGLADSIYAGTKKKDLAWQWVKFLASPDCQKLVGQKGVVFPAHKDALKDAEAAFTQKGVDVSAFTTHVKDKTTFLFPITENAADVEAIMGPAMDAVMSGKADASSLTQANDKVNALFK